ncbi:MAG: oxidoreductase [Phycisphaeraceae bacterium]|nr:oxidoreductase [Phycisphaeraceae bacterium]
MTTNRSERVLAEPGARVEAAHVVVGSGPGGAITACLLAEHGRDVMLIEEGAYHPQDSCPDFSVLEMEQKYRAGGLTVAMGKPNVAYVEGRCVGGGSEINSGLYHRTPPDILARWRQQFGIRDLDEADLTPHFEAVERDLEVQTHRGTLPPASLKLSEGSQRLGWNCVEVPRWFSYERDPRGRRKSMTESYVPRALDAGCRLLPNTRAHRIVRAGRGWEVRAHQQKRGSILIRAEHLFLAAGAVQTPALLRRSGIREAVGDDLQMHPTVKLLARFDDTVNDPGMGVPVHQVKQFAPRMSFGCSISARPFLALTMLDHAADADAIDEQWHHSAIYYAMIRGGGRGRIRTIPGLRDPLVRYRLSDAAMTDLAEGLNRLARVLFEAGARACYPSFAGGAGLTGPDQLDRWPAQLPVDRTNVMTIHLFSSCPMGERLGHCPVDSYGRVRAADRLHVADASIIPGPPGVNPQGTVMALARRNTLRYLDAL